LKNFTFTSESVTEGHPDKMADQVRTFLKEGMLNILGGCCGTTPDHIRALAQLAAEYSPRQIDQLTEEEEQHA